MMHEYGDALLTTLQKKYLLINAKDTPRNTAATIGATNARMTASY
jgi:hypothetical protein